MKTASNLFVGLTLLLAGCNDDAIEPACDGTCAVITGRFLTDGGQRGIANVPLKLDWEERSYITRGDTHHKAVATTDADGKYTLRFRVSDDESKTIGTYRMSYQANATEFIVGEPSEGLWISGQDIVKRDTIIISDWLLPHKAYIHYEVTNPDQVTANFNVQYRFYRGPFTGGGDFDFGPHKYFYGSPRDASSGDVEVAANQQVELNVFKAKNGVETTQLDTIQLAIGAHYTHRITY